MNADQLIFKSGRTLEGTVINQGLQSVTLRTSNGKVVTVKKSNLKFIKYKKMDRPDESLTEEKDRPEKDEDEPGLSKDAIEINVDRPDGGNEASRRESEKGVKKGPTEREKAYRAMKLSFSQNSAQEARVWGYMHRDHRAKDDESRRENQGDLPADDIPSVLEQPSITRWGALWRSALVPGWGQYHQGRNIAAVSYASLFAAAAGATGSAEKSAIKANRAYNESADQVLYSMAFPVSGLSSSFPASIQPFYDHNAGLIPGYSYAFLFYSMQSRSNQSTAISRQNTYYGVAGGLALVYLLNLADVYWFHPEDQNVDLSFSPLLDERNSGLSVQFRTRF